MDRLSLADAATANLATHASWTHLRTPGMHADVAADLVLVDSGLACDTFNLLCRARLDRGSSADRIRRAIDYFTGVGRPFSWWLSPGDQPADLADRLIAAGLQAAETELAMAAELARLEAIESLPKGLRIERVRTREQLRDFARVVAANWTPADTNVIHFYELAAPVLLTTDCPLWFYVAYAGSEPVAASELTLGGGVVGLYSICTLEAHRRQGYGSALTMQPLLDARATGFRTAILQASAQGAGIYRRIGFAIFGEITEYKAALA
jgi:ribosomal protein S18 acetylase RimI-like enzyme